MPSKRKHEPLASIVVGGRPGATAKTDDTPEPRRRAIYAAHGEAQAGRLKGGPARYAVARKYVMTIMKVEAVEAEGLAKGWPTA